MCNMKHCIVNVFEDSGQVRANDIVFLVDHFVPQLSFYTVMLSSLKSLERPRARSVLEIAARVPPP